MNHKTAKIFLIPIIFFAVFFAFGNEAKAASTLHVDVVGVHGACSDSRSYEEAQNQITPFCSIQKASDVANPGDTVIVADGTYTEIGEPPYYLIYLRRGGNSLSWVTFKAENMRKAVIDGQDNILACIGLHHTANYVRIEGFAITGCDAGIQNNDSGTPGGSYSPAQNVYIYKNHIYHVAIVGASIAWDSDNWTFDSNEIHDVYKYVAYGNQYHGLYVSHDSSNVLIINNVIYDTPYGWPIHLYGHGSPNRQENNKIINNTLADESKDVDGQIIIAAYVNNLLIENNIFYNPKNAAIRAYYTNVNRGVIIGNNITNIDSMCTDNYCGDIIFTNNQTNTNPLFANPTNRNYHLQSNSPAIDNGLADNAPTYDIEGTLRPQGTTIPKLYDIGAHEYQPDVANMIPDWSDVSQPPFPLVPAAGITNPVLTAQNVTDIPGASFVADPFIFYENGQWYMFFEVFVNADRYGRISVAKSTDGLHWTYDRKVLDDGFHHSYPGVFKYGNEYYMLPESFRQNKVTLYKATNFPYEWEEAATLMSGKGYNDPIILRHDNTWWMFLEYDWGTHLYFSDNLLSGWQEHPQSPIVPPVNKSKSVGGGRSFVYNGGQVVRIAQDDFAHYADAVRAFAVDTLTKTDYAEHEIPESPILHESGSGWNSLGMHHFDPWRVGNRWIAAADGFNGSYSIGIYTNAGDILPPASPAGLMVN